MKQEIDSRIKAAFHQECDGISASEDLKCRIDAAVCKQQAGQERRASLKHFRGKKLIAAAAAACLLVSGISGIAAGNVDFFVSTSRMGSDYTDYRDMDKVEKKLGYAVDSVEQFANGFAFESVNIDSTVAVSEENGEMYRVPSMDARYRKDGKLIDLIVSETAGENATDIHAREPQAARMCGDITLRYHEYTNKIVPPGYALTAEDMVNDQRDDFEIVYFATTTTTVTTGDAATDEEGAADEVDRDDYHVAVSGYDRDVAVTLRQTGQSWEEWTENGEPYLIQTKIVSWEKEGKYYDLMGADLDLGAEELFDMAEELIGVR